MAGINQLESLRVFSAVVECGSFTTAANRLGVSAAWVSKSVERLESRLGTTLLRRSTRHMQVTSSGERCYMRALEVLSKWDALEDDLCESNDSPRGKLRIGVPMSWGLSKFGSILNMFMDRYPEILLDIQMGDHYVNVLEEKFDLVLRLTNELADSALLCRKITSYHRVACAAPEYLKKYGEPGHPRELSDHHCLVYTLPGKPSVWQFKDKGKWLDIYLEPRLTSNNSKLLHCALLEGKGIALIPHFIIDDDLREGRLVPILTGFQTAELNLYSLRPGDRMSSYRLKLLYNFICEQLGE
ncbi:LysR family transcriptional regulator [Microbulbifer sp. SSSA008]|uniref:LysR family transcriptional regulator n=1 Tax=Microbulbifer sp. SSSA008 TaxID=3243380 RepID=UPI00403901E3